MSRTRVLLPPGEGTLGQLSVNDSLYGSLTEAVESVRLLVDDLRAKSTCRSSSSIGLWVSADAWSALRRLVLLMPVEGSARGMIPPLYQPGESRKPQWAPLSGRWKGRA